MWKCTKCKSENIVGIEYRGTKEDYDGVSEWKCLDCGLREGRWSKKELKDGEIEKKYGGK